MRADKAPSAGIGNPPLPPATRFPPDPPADAAKAVVDTSHGQHSGLSASHPTNAAWYTMLPASINVYEVELHAPASS